MDNPSSNPSADVSLEVKNAQLEARIGELEQAVLRINEFNNAVTNGLTHALQRLNSIEPLLGVAALSVDKIARLTSLEALTKASHIFPKSRTVVFVARGYFGDNLKHAYLAFNEFAHGKNIAVQFLTEDKEQFSLLTAHGLPCLPTNADEWTVDQIRAVLGAKVAVISDNFHWQSLRNPKPFGLLQGAKTVQLWHGIPIKNVGLRYILRGDNVLLEELISSSGNFDVFVAPGSKSKDEWAEMFAFKEFAPLGYPRNDVLFREPTAMDLLNTDIDTLQLLKEAQAAGKPTMLYTPTYRDDEAFNWFENSGFVAFRDHAKAQGYTVVINLHPFEQHATDRFRERYPGLHFLAPNTDIYPVLKYADILITDYSSLAFDYLLLDRPLVFFRPDHEHYMTKQRGFIPGRERLTPGEVIPSVKDLNRAADAAVNYARAPATDPFRIARHDLRGKMFDHVDGNAAQRICERIEALIEAD